MTIKGFANKYGIPYSIAYQASFEVHPVSTMIRDRDYPEGDLYRATKKLLAKRIEDKQKQVAENQRLLAQMKGRKAQ